jgi:hypothetical protein
MRWRGTKEKDERGLEIIGVYKEVWWMKKS